MANLLVEGRELAEAGIVMAERGLGVPEFERPADAHDQRLRPDPGVAADHRREDDRALLVDRRRLGEAEKPPEPPRAGRGRVAFLGDPAPLAIGVERTRIGRVIGDEAGIMFVAPDQQGAGVRAPGKSKADEAGKEESPFFVHGAKRTSAEQMIDHKQPRTRRRGRMIRKSGKPEASGPCGNETQQNMWSTIRFWGSGAPSTPFD